MIMSFKGGNKLLFRQARLLQNAMEFKMVKLTKMGNAMMYQKIAGPFYSGLVYMWFLN
jgi:hypothetical protein